MKTRDIKPFGLRLNPPLKDRVRGCALKNRRSMNTEIELLIEEALALRSQSESAQFSKVAPT